MSFSIPLWRQILKSNFTNWVELADFLQLDLNQREFILKKTHFPLNLPRRLAEKIQKQTLCDPILLQFLPTENEVQSKPGYYKDPVQDTSFQKKTKLLQKYQGRVLLISTSACAMHCRYCFRQNFEYNCTDKIFEEEIQYIAEDPTVYEVILSGGDPLSLSDKILGDLINRLETISHIKILRFHTRFPIGIPERINEDFLNLIKNRRLQTLFVIHANHSLELDLDVLHALKKLQICNSVILNQSVLLKDVNDNLIALKELCLKLIQNGILPYYLHQLDKVQGASHFEVSEAKGKDLINQLSKEIPGYALPRYVKEIAGEQSKMSIY